VEAHLLYVRFLDFHGSRGKALTHLEASADQGIEPAVLLDEAVRLSLENAEVDQARRYAERLNTEHPNHVHTLLANARMAVATRDFDTAVELLGRANEIEESAESQRLLGMAEYGAARLAEAQRAVGRSLELEPTNPSALALQARIHYQGGDWAGVLESLRRLRATGTRMGVQERLFASQSLYQLGRNRAGRALLDQLLKTDPPPESAVVAFARNEFRRDPETTARLLDEALARRPDSVALLTSATVFDLRSGELDRALERLDLGLEKKPNVPILLALRAQILLRAGRLEEAERDARQAFERRPDMPRILELLLAIYRQQGRVDVAIEQLEASESAGLLRPYDRVLLGRLHLGKGDTDRAAELYEAALAEDPDLAGAKNDLAFLLAREGRDLDRALELAQDAQQALGEEPAVIDTLGYVMLRRGLAGPAAEQFGSAIRLAEERGEASAGLLYHMGLALRALGQEGAAAERFEKALSMDPEFADAQDARRQLEEARAAASPGDAPAS
jgi:tetratricopeptide (TPR) repeat protein